MLDAKRSASLEDSILVRISHPTVIFVNAGEDPIAYDIAEACVEKMAEIGYNTLLLPNVSPSSTHGEAVTYFYHVFHKMNAILEKYKVSELSANANLQTLDINAIKENLLRSISFLSPEEKSKLSMHESLYPAAVSLKCYNKIKSLISLIEKSNTVGVKISGIFSEKKAETATTEKRNADLIRTERGLEIAKNIMAAQSSGKNAYAVVCPEYAALIKTYFELNNLSDNIIFFAPFSQFLVRDHDTFSSAQSLSSTLGKDIFTVLARDMINTYVKKCKSKILSAVDYLATKNSRIEPLKSQKPAEQDAETDHLDNFIFYFLKLTHEKLGVWFVRSLNTAQGLAISVSSESLLNQQITMVELIKKINDLNIKVSLSKNEKDQTVISIYNIQDSSVCLKLFNKPIGQLLQEATAYIATIELKKIFGIDFNLNVTRNPEDKIQIAAIAPETNFSADTSTLSMVQKTLGQRGIFFRRAIIHDKNQIIIPDIGTYGNTLKLLRDSKIP